MNLMSKDDFRRVWSVMNPSIFTTRLFFDPLSVPLTIVCSKIRWITANQITFLALIFGLIGAWFFTDGHFLLGALGYYIFFLLDTMDGRLARLRGGGDPLGAFYDFIVDRMVMGAMLLGMGWAFVRAEMLPEFVAVQCFLLLFFLKDVLDLKWKEGQVPTTWGNAEKEVSRGLLTRYKIHFKPGQLLSCFVVFLVAPITKSYLCCICVAILFVLFSLAQNVFLPLLFKKKLDDIR